MSYASCYLLEPLTSSARTSCVLYLQLQLPYGNAKELTFFQLNARHWRRNFIHIAFCRKAEQRRFELCRNWGKFSRSKLGLGLYALLRKFLVNDAQTACAGPEELKPAPLTLIIEWKSSGEQNAILFQINKLAETGKWRKLHSFTHSSSQKRYYCHCGSPKGRKNTNLMKSGATQRFRVKE